MSGTSPSKLWTSDFILGTFSNFVASCNYFMLMVVMTDFALEKYSAPASLAGFMASIFIIGTLVSRMLGPLLIELCNKKPLLITGAVFEIFLSALYLLDMPLIAMLMLRFAHGFAFGILSTTLATFITTIVPARRKGEGIGYYMLSSTLGAAIGPFAGILISRHLGYEMLFLSATLFVIFAIPLIAPIKVKLCEENLADTIDEIASVEVASADASKKEELGAKTSKASIACNASKKRLNKISHVHFFEPKALSIGLVGCLVFFAYSAILTFLTPYAIEVNLTRAASVYFIAYALSMFVTRPISGRIFDRRGASIVMIPAFLATAAGMSVLALASNDWMMLGSAVLCGYGVGTVQSCGLAMAVKKVPVSALASTNATFYVLVDSGVGLGPVILGAILPMIGYSSMYFCMAAACIIAFVIFLIISRKEKSA